MGRVTRLSISAASPIPLASATAEKRSSFLIASAVGQSVPCEEKRDDDNKIKPTESLTASGDSLWRGLLFLRSGVWHFSDCWPSSAGGGPVAHLDSKGKVGLFARSFLVASRRVWCKRLQLWLWSCARNGSPVAVWNENALSSLNRKNIHCVGPSHEFLGFGFNGNLDSL